MSFVAEVKIDVHLIDFFNLDVTGGSTICSVAASEISLILKYNKIILSFISSLFLNRHPTKSYSNFHLSSMLV